MANCRTCEREITWAMSSTGRRIPLDARSVQGHVYEVHKRDGRGVADRTHHVVFARGPAHQDGDLVPSRQRIGHGGEAIGRPPLGGFVCPGIQNNERSIHVFQQSTCGAVFGVGDDQLHPRVDSIHPQREPSEGQVVLERRNWLNASARRGEPGR